MALCFVFKENVVVSFYIHKFVLKAIHTKEMITVLAWRSIIWMTSGLWLCFVPWKACSLGTILCRTEISRIWSAEINYLAPNKRYVRRCKLAAWLPNVALEKSNLSYVKVTVIPGAQFQSQVSESTASMRLKLRKCMLWYLVPQKQTSPLLFSPQGFLSTTGISFLSFVKESTGQQLKVFLSLHFFRLFP